MVASHHWPLDQAHEPSVRTCGSSRTEQGLLSQRRVIMTRGVHLGDLLRIWVRTGTKITLSPSDFKGQQKAHGHRKRRGAFTRTGPISGRADSRDTNSYKKR
ncbi:hypothetical protein JTE90_015582 [Oedothorax gibbosus]|uniref:Uncharacterized protein n=1 Tax=Oedothorax gibbosus TaxID=931172 RepID=A0AAV6TJ25_9ARAC|nr:hypothetical protein JTE90_015582 [Oedothorax gibbosus]